MFERTPDKTGASIRTLRWTDSGGETVVRACDYDRFGETLSSIVAIDPQDWHRGQGWECVAFIQQMAKEALDAD